MELIKKADTEWMGNGFGSRCAEWGIEGFDGYTLKGSTGSWSVWRDSDHRRMVTGSTRKEAAELFVEIHGEVA